MRMKMRLEHERRYLEKFAESEHTNSYHYSQPSSRYSATDAKRHEELRNRSLMES